jgi:hypothetical protein
VADLREFAKQIRLLGKAVEENADTLVRKTALAIDTGVVMATPVKTGRARANWRVQAGSMNPETLPPPSSPGAGVSAALAEALTAVAEYRGEGEIHISNNLPYIHRLNAGSSTQAPEGFVELAVQRAAEAVRSADLLKGGDLSAEIVATGEAVK